MGFNDIGEVPKVLVHDLFSREIKPIYNSKEWLDRWNAAATLEEMIGLLHCGFTVPPRNAYNEPEYDQSDCILFYLKIADGWADDDLLRTPEEIQTHSQAQYDLGYDQNGNRRKIDANEVRQIVAVKAFELVSHNFFRKREKDEPGRPGALSGRLFPAIQSFFRLEQGRYSFQGEVVRNAPRLDSTVPSQRFAIDFLISLARYVWGWEPEN